MKSERLTFTSSAFQPIPSEDDETNPGIFGRALAERIAQVLSIHGIATGEVLPEDFGWLVPVRTAPHKTYVACASSEDAPSMWQLFVFAEGGIFSRLLGKGGRKRDVSRMFEAVQTVLYSHPEVHNLKVEP